MFETYRLAPWSWDGIGVRGWRGPPSENSSGRGELWQEAGRDFYEGCTPFMFCNISSLHGDIHFIPKSFPVH